MTTRSDQRLLVKDGLLSTELFEKLSKVVGWLPMYFLSRTDRDPNAHPLDVYWYYPLVSVADRLHGDAAPQFIDLDEAFQPVRELWEIVQAAAGCKVRLYECEVTANGFGNEGHPHFDSPEVDARPNHVTAVVYCNNEWKPEWGGETVVLDEQDGHCAAVLPKPGRMTLMYTDPFHVARPVSRLCPIARRIIVFKMWRADA